MSVSFSSRCLLAIAGACAATLLVHAQAPAHPDLSGTWDTGYFTGAIGFVQPQKLEGGSVCVSGCAPAGAARAGGAPAAARGGAAPAAGRGAAAAGGRAAAAGGGAAGSDFPKYKPELLAKVKDLDERQVQMDSVLRCAPPGVPRIGPPHKIVQSARDIVFLYDDVNGGFFRVVRIDGRPHRKGAEPSYLGDSTGRWEGDTLVVETVGFNDDTWLTDNGAFHSKDLRVVERLRRVGETLEYQATAYDPAVLAEPWTLRPRTLRLTDKDLDESARCEDRSLAFMQDSSHHTNPR